MGLAFGAVGHAPQSETTLPHWRETLSGCQKCLPRANLQGTREMRSLPTLHGAPNTVSTMSSINTMDYALWRSAATSRSRAPVLPLSKLHAAKGKNNKKPLRLSNAVRHTLPARFAHSVHDVLNQPNGFRFVAQCCDLQEPSTSGTFPTGDKQCCLLRARDRRSSQPCPFRARKKTLKSHADLVLFAAVAVYKCHL